MTLPLKLAALAALAGNVSGQLLALQAAVGAQRDTALFLITAATFVGSGVTALATTFMFIGRYRQRLTAVETDVETKADLEAFKELHKDVREIRNFLMGTEPNA